MNPDSQNSYLPLCFSLWQSAGLKHIVISPGSRSAPLVRAVVDNGNFRTYIVPDERVAGFMALGMAQSLKSPVALICTSGTAVYNYAPAVAEAFFTNTSLLILSADRPPEWINQNDGQTIFQDNIFDKHVVASFQMPVNVNEKGDYLYCSRIAKNTIDRLKKGSVHINFPFREPLYQPFEALDKDLAQGFQWNEKIDVNPKFTLDQTHLDRLYAAQKILIVIGEQAYNTEIRARLAQFVNYSQCVIVADILSNCHGLFAEQHKLDKYLHFDDKIEKDLQPDFLITFGRSVVSKRLKKWLRKLDVKHHWMIDETDTVPKNTFNTNYTHFNVPVDLMLSNIIEGLDNNVNTTINYANLWCNWFQGNEKNKNINQKELSDYNVISAVMSSLPNEYHMHLANSMPIRYINYLGCDNSSIVFHGNRGTCGIEGSVSTALGHAIVSKNNHLVLVGDMSFFYDRNAWWHQYKPKNIKILVVNNFGGGIFDMIEGPAKAGLVDQYFVTEQNMCAAHLASEFDIDYHLIKKIDNINVLEDRIKTWLNDTHLGSSIMEVQTSRGTNSDVYSKIDL